MLEVKVRCFCVAIARLIYQKIRRKMKRLVTTACVRMAETAT